MMPRLDLPRDLQRLTAPLRRNVTAKVFALAFAFVLWFFVNAGKRETQVFQFPIELRNIPERTVLANRDRLDSVAVKLNGPGALLASLDSRRSPIAVDLSTVKIGEEARLKITDEMIHVPRGVRVLDVEPSRVSLRLEGVREATVPVHLARKGEPASGYRVGSISVTPAEATVSGPASAVEAIETVDTETIDIGGLSQSVGRTVALVRDDPMVSMVPDRVTVQIEVEAILKSRQISNVALAVRNVDRPFKLRPERVNLTVRGAKAAVEELQLETGSVYVDGAERGPGEHRVQVEVLLPEGVELQKRDPATVILQVLERKDGARR